MIAFEINGKPVEVEADPLTPLLWVIRDHLDLIGTKFGCGIGQCGACTVHLDGRAIRSCQMPLEAVAGARVTTIEGLSADASHPVQQAWIHEDVPQCGYCQPGMIMATVAFLEDVPRPSDQDIDAGITNICRCGTYNRIRRAIKRAASMEAE